MRCDHIHNVIKKYGYNRTNIYKNYLTTCSYICTDCGSILDNYLIIDQNKNTLLKQHMLYPKMCYVTIRREKCKLRNICRRYGLSISDIEDILCQYVKYLTELTLNGHIIKGNNRRALQYICIMDNNASKYIDENDLVLNIGTRKKNITHIFNKYEGILKTYSCIN